MRRDKKWLTHAAPAGFVLPECTKDKHWSMADGCDDAGRISIPMYRKTRGQDV